MDINEEKKIAIREAHQIPAADEYFSAREECDTENNRKLFTAGYKRGYEAKEKQSEIKIKELLLKTKSLASAFKLVLTKTSIGSTESTIQLINEIEKIEKSLLDC